MDLNFLQPANTRWELGDLEISPIISEFSVRHPIAELTTPLVWQGDMVLAQKLGVPFSESLHELENPERWERGQHPLKLYFWNNLFLTLRIAEYFYDEDTATAKATLTDLLGLLDYRSPPAECEGLEIGFQNRWQDVVRFLLVQGGIIDGVTYLTKENILFDSDLTEGYYETPIIKTGSYVKTAQEIAGAHGCWLWVDKDEKVRISRYPVNTPEPLSVLSRAQIDLYQRQPTPEGPFDKVIVTGTKEAIANCPKGDPPIIETFGEMNGRKVLLSREIRKVKETGDRKIVFQVHKDQAKGDLFPDEHPGSLALITAENSIETRYFNEEGYATKIVSNKDIPQGVALKDIPKFKGKTALLTNAEKVEEEFFYTPDGVCYRKVKTTWGRFPIIVDASDDFFDDVDYSGLIIREEIEERWIQKPSTPDPEKPPCLRWEYTRVTKRRTIEEKSSTIIRDGKAQTTTRKGPGGLSVVQSESSPDSTPSGGPTQDPKYPIGTVALKGEVALQPVGYQTFAPRQTEVNVNWLSSNANAQKVAELLAKLLWQRRFCRFISHPCYQWFCDGWRPFIRVDVHQGSWIVDGLAVACTEGEAEFSWTGNFLGKIEEVAIPVDPPVWRFVPEIDPDTGLPVRDETGAYIYPLQVGSIPNLQFIKGMAINPVRIPAVGGTLPYTYDLTNLPTGLSVVGGYLVGTPTTTGIYNGEIEISDGTDAVTLPLTITITAVASPIPPVAAILTTSSAGRVRQSRFRVEDSFLAPDMVLGGIRKRISHFEPNPIDIGGLRYRNYGAFSVVEPGERISEFIAGPPSRTIEYYLIDGEKISPSTVGGGIDGSGFGSPNGTVTPDYIGQLYFDGIDTLVSIGLTSDDWELIGK
jgi:hypothetical protein